jgi:hypothetical protein
MGVTLISDMLPPELPIDIAMASNSSFPQNR